MAESVREVLDRLLAKARQLQLRGTPEPDTADEDESDAPAPGKEASDPEKAR